MYPKQPLRKSVLGGNTYWCYDFLFIDASCIALPPGRWEREKNPNIDKI